MEYLKYFVLSKQGGSTLKLLAGNSKLGTILVDLPNNRFIHSSTYPSLYKVADIESNGFISYLARLFPNIQYINTICLPEFQNWTENLWLFQNGSVRDMPVPNLDLHIMSIPEYISISCNHVYSIMDQHIISVLQLLTQHSMYIFHYGPAYYIMYILLRTGICSTIIDPA